MTEQSPCRWQGITCEKPSHRLASSWQRTHRPNPCRSLRKSDATPHAYPPA
uniref:Uncharacterized protein n=1 Tax=Nelumbo nucifera TaxID=4432 RepID=A0A822YIL3_NELNU|nr:TPA_asm: hypothetical protein HUJ06_009607 [Nelumbo nucifera]